MSFSINITRVVNDFHLTLERLGLDYDCVSGIKYECYLYKYGRNHQLDIRIRIYDHSTCLDFTPFCCSPFVFYTIIHQMRMLLNGVELRQTPEPIFEILNLANDPFTMDTLIQAAMSPQTDTSRDALDVLMSCFQRPENETVFWKCARAEKLIHVLLNNVYDVDHVTAGLDIRRRHPTSMDSKFILFVLAHTSAEWAAAHRFIAEMITSPDAEVLAAMFKSRFISHHHHQPTLPPAVPPTMAPAPSEPSEPSEPICKN